MRIPIRMMGIATMFFWMFLVAFFVSAVYSVKDTHFDFGEPQMGLTADNELVFFLPVGIVNRGFYDIGFFNITTEISDEEGFIITHGSTFIPIIKKGEEVTTTHNMTIDADSLLRSYRNYLFNDTELKIHEILSMRIAELIPVEASTNLSVHWGAPLYNFALGEAEYTVHNQTHLRVVVPISFENHAFFDLTGNIQIRSYDSKSKLLGDGQTTIEAHQNSAYQGYVELYVRETAEIEHFEVHFVTQFFDYTFGDSL